MKKEVKINGRLANVVKIGANKRCKDSCQAQATFVPRNSMNFIKPSNV